MSFFGQFSENSRGSQRVNINMKIQRVNVNAFLILVEHIDCQLRDNS